MKIIVFSIGVCLSFISILKMKCCLAFSNFSFGILPVSVYFMLPTPSCSAIFSIFTSVGLYPIIVAATVSSATKSGDAIILFVITGFPFRGPIPSWHMVASATA